MSIFTTFITDAIIHSWSILKYLYTTFGQYLLILSVLSSFTRTSVLADREIKEGIHYRYIGTIIASPSKNNR